MTILRFILAMPFYLITMIITLIVTILSLILILPFGLLSTIIYGDDLPGIKLNLKEE